MSIHTHAAKGDILALTAELASGVSVEARDEQGRTPLMIAAESPQADSTILQFLLEQGANVNALSTPPVEIVELDEDIRAEMEAMGIDTSIYDAPKKDQSVDSVLSYAVKTATHDKILVLLEAGADVSYVDANGYSVLTYAMYRACAESADNLREILGTLIDAGAPLDVESSYGESALSVASHRGEFSAVEYLLQRGADPKPLGWTPLFQQVAAGNLNEVVELVDHGAALDQRDGWERTPFLLSVHAGHREVAEFLLDRGSDRSATGRCGKTALMFAISRDDEAMLKWLIEMGWDVEESDDFGSFPLVEAARGDAIASVQVLLNAGVAVGRRNEYGNGAIHEADSSEVVQLLVAAGEELSDIDSELRLKLIGADPHGVIEASEEDYNQNKHRVFGKRNPDEMNNPFWELMIHTRMSAYSATQKYGEASCDRDPVWCFTRFGQSISRLPDGRFVEIAGEHEDHYDPDFCIYNDVVVHHGDGTFDIFGYPIDVFPPTDFHSATLVGPHIYIIGNLGYPHYRQPGSTPVFRLDCQTWAIERIDCGGEAPGWIHNHKAKLDGEQQIVIHGGLIEDGSSEDLVENSKEFVLDLKTFTWKMNG